jgi:hypothetical protein
VRAKALAATLAALTISLALVLPGGAAAKVHYSKQPASVSAELHLRGTHGFRVSLYVSDGRSVIVSASKEVSKSGSESVDYFTVHPNGPAHAFDRGELNVRVGRLGRFHARFVPTSTKTEAAVPGCKGEATTVEKGFFVGSLAFHGERDYTSVAARRARGTVTKTGAARCRIEFPATVPGHQSARHAKAEKEREEEEVRLVAGDPKGDAVFQARREATPAGLAGATTLFLASASGKVGDLLVDRNAFVFDFQSDAAETFLTPNLAEPLAEATLEPPAPFSGSATFHLDTPKKASWTGDLAVELPGIAPVPLTGEGIAAGICAGRTNCTDTLPKRLAPILQDGGGSSYGSSDSQGFVGSFVAG